MMTQETREKLQQRLVDEMGAAVATLVEEATAELRQELEATRRNLLDARQKIDALEGGTAVTETVVSQLNNAKAQLRRQDEQITRLETSNANRSDHIQELTQARDQLLSDLATAKEEVDDLREQVNELRSTRVERVLSLLDNKGDLTRVSPVSMQLIVHTLEAAGWLRDPEVTT